MKNACKKSICFILVLIMMLGIIPLATITAFAENTENEATQENNANEETVDRTQERVTITNGDYSLSINKTSFEVGEPILVSGTGTDSNTWIGLYSAEGVAAGDSTILWRYVRNAGQGVEFDLVSTYDAKEDKEFEMPNGTLPEGEYIVRLFGDSSSNPNSVKALVHIRVGNPTDVVGEQDILSTDKRVYTSGEAIMVSADQLYDDTWVGVYAYGNYSKSSLGWYWVRNAGDGVPYNAVAGKTLAAGIYMIRLCPHDGNGFGNDIAYTLVLVDDEYTDSYLNYLGDSTTGGDNTGGDNIGDDNTGDDNTGGDNTGEDTTVQGTYESTGAPAIITNGDYSLTVNKTVFDVGEKIMVSGTGVSSTDWIGIFRTNQNASVLWQYVSTAGQNVSFDLRTNHVVGADNTYKDLPEGEYVIRLQANDSSNLADCKALVHIKVGNPSVVEGDSTLLSTDKRVYAQGEPIMVSATAVNSDSWVGIYNYSNYQNNKSTKWFWVEDDAGGNAFDITRGATLDPGHYLIRLLPHDTTDMTTEVAYTTIVIEGDNALSFASEVRVNEELTDNYLATNKTTYLVGEPIYVTAIGSGADWIGISLKGETQAIRWCYIDSENGGAGSGATVDIREAINIGGVYTDSDLKNIPAGEYQIHLVLNDQMLTAGAYKTIDIKVEDKTSSVAGPIDATYEITGQNGFAGGTVTVTMDAFTNRNIVMYWADANGILDGYTMHARFKVTGEQTSFTFTDSMIIPSGATRLLVYAQNATTLELSNDYVSVDLPQDSQMNITGEKVTSIVVVSDIHIGSSTGNANFKKLIADAIALYPNGAPVFVVGDVADNGTSAQYEQALSLYNEVLTENGKEAKNYPLFYAIGNHDYPAASETFLKYAFLPNGTNPTDTCYDFWLDGYHYVILGSDSPSGLNATFTEETLAWLDSTLAQDRKESRPTFVFLHQPLYNTVSGSLPGEGWHGVTNDSELREVLKKYPEVIMFNGHTHWTMDSSGNIFEGTEDLPIKIFNCASVSYLCSGFEKTSGIDFAGSQGYFVDIYKDKVVVKGRDLTVSQWIPNAQYLIEMPHNYDVCVDISYDDFSKTGKKTLKCTNCDDTITVEAPALFTCRGYSAPEDGRGGIAIGFTVNNEAIAEYEEATGEKVSYGVFAALAEKIGANDIFGADGKALAGVIVADITNTGFDIFNLKIVGFTDEQKDTKLAMGAFVGTTKDGKTEYAYLQGGTPETGAKYFFASYNDVKAIVDNKNGVSAQ